jgi:hypothetical protein
MRCSKQRTSTTMQAPTPDEKKNIVKKFLDDQAEKDLVSDVVAQKTPRCESYLQYYEKILGLSSHNYNISIGKAAYPDHAAICSMVDKLQINPALTKSQFKDQFAPTVSEYEKDNAIRALVRVAFMMDCAPRDRFEEGYMVRDFIPRLWHMDQSWADFAELCFPPIIQSQTMLEGVHAVMAQREKLKAWKLKKRYKVKLRPTDDLAEHLVFDPQLRTLKIFRHVSFLRAHLRRSKSENIDLGFFESLKK